MVDIFLDKELDHATVRNLKENANWFLLLGIGTIIAGMLALTYTFASTVFSVVYIGFFLLVLSVFEFIKSFKIRYWRNFLLHIVLAMLYGFCGFYIIQHPMLSALTLTMLLAISFVVSGVMKLFFACSKQTPHKFWLALDGCVTLLLGILVYAQWPASGFWVIGMLVGVSMVVTGWTWVMLSVAVKDLK